MPADIFMVIPTALAPAPIPIHIAADPVQDSYFGKNFPNAVAVVELRSFSLSAENPVTIGSTTGGAGAGKARFNPLLVEKAVDRLSPSLFMISASGAHFPTVQIFVRKAGGSAPQGAKPYLAYEFSMVYVTQVAWSGGGGDEAPAEQVTFNYGALTLGYYSQTSDGSFDTLTKLGWSQITNMPAKDDALQRF